MTAPGLCPCSDHPHVWNATWCYLYERPIYCPHADGECPNRKPSPKPSIVPTGTGWPVA